MDRESPLPIPDTSHDAGMEDGIDVALIRWMLSLTPGERLDVLQGYVDSMMELRRGIQDP